MSKNGVKIIKDLAYKLIAHINLLKMLKNGELITQQINKPQKEICILLNVHILMMY